jgi:hypothetical protein
MPVSLARVNVAAATRFLPESYSKMVGDGSTKITFFMRPQKNK